MTEAAARRAGVTPALLETVVSRPFSGAVYRSIGSRFLQAPLSSAGSQLHGGRFNPPGSFEVLYTALAADTALAERERILLTSAGIKLPRGVRTSVLLRIQCRLVSVLDLDNETVRQHLRIPLADLLAPWLPWNVPAHAAGETTEPSSRAPVIAAPSQRIGVTVHRSRRFEAILTPSTKDAAGRCLAIFPDRLQPGSVVAVDDPEGVIVGALGIGRERSRA